MAQHAGAGAFLVEGGHLLLLGVGLVVDSRLAWIVVLLLGAALSLVAWIGASRRAEAIALTPSSRVASAAQGYVELAGRAEPVGDGPLRDPVTGTECVWYRVESLRCERSHDTETWEPAGNATSSRPIGLRDDSGLCLLQPEGADIAVGWPETVMGDPDTRHTVWRIRPGEPLYAIGSFRTDALPEPVHVMTRPADGRPYLISNRPQAHTLRRYRWRQWFHLGVFAVALVAALR